MQICLRKSTIALKRSDVQLPNTVDVNIFLHPSASNLGVPNNPGGPNPSLVLIAAFLTNSSFMSSKIIR